MDLIVLELGNSPSGFTGSRLGEVRECDAVERENKFIG